MYAILSHIIEERINLINQRRSPIQDEYIEKYLSERELDLVATLDAVSAYKDADYIIIATPTNYDPKQNFFDCSAVESVIETVIAATEDRCEKPTIVIKSTIPVGYTESVKKKYNINNIIFSPEFCGNQKHCMITFIRVVSLLGQMRKTGRQLQNLHHC